MGSGIAGCSHYCHYPRTTHHEYRLHRIVPRRLAAPPTVADSAWPAGEAGDGHRGDARRRGGRLGRGQPRQRPAGRRGMGRRRVGRPPRLACPRRGRPSFSSGDELAKRLDAVPRQPVCQGGVGYGVVGPQRPAAKSTAARASRRWKECGTAALGCARAVGTAEGGCATAVEVGPTFDRMDSIDEFAAQLGAAVEAGFTRVKLKFRPGWDVQMVDFVRKEFPTLDDPHRLRRGLDAGPQRNALSARRFHAGHDRAALGGRRSGGPCHVAGIAPHADLPRRKHCVALAGRHGDGIGQLQVREPQAGPRRRTDGGRSHPRSVSRALYALLRRRDAAERRWRADRFRPGHERELHLSGRFFSFRPILAEDVAEPLLPTKDPADGRQRVRLSSAAGIGVEPQRDLLDKLCIAREKIR